MIILISLLILFNFKTASADTINCLDADSCTPDATGETVSCGGGGTYPCPCGSDIASCGSRSTFCCTSPYVSDCFSGGGCWYSGPESCGCATTTTTIPPDCVWGLFGSWTCPGDGLCYRTRTCGPTGCIDTGVCSDGSTETETVPDTTTTVPPTSTTSLTTSTTSLTTSTTSLTTSTTSLTTSTTSLTTSTTSTGTSTSTVCPATETSCIDGIDNDCDGLTDCADPECNGLVNGTVKNENDNVIPGANIDIKIDLTTVKSTSTDIQGMYSANINCGIYNIIASNPNYWPSAKSNINIPPKQSVVVNFILAKGTSCEQDCTFVSDNLVHAACDGVNGCTFCDSTSKAACDLSQPGWARDYNSTHYVICAPGCPQQKVEIQASLTCSSGTIVKITRIVFYNGRPVRLIVATCG